MSPNKRSVSNEASDKPKATRGETGMAQATATPVMSTVRAEFPRIALATGEAETIERIATHRLPMKPVAQDGSTIGTSRTRVVGTSRIVSTEKKTTRIAMMKASLALARMAVVALVDFKMAQIAAMKTSTKVGAVRTVEAATEM